MAVAGDLQHEYLPIAEHGLVGDLHTVALVGTTGTIDWYCCPAFDSPSVFGCILDAEQGGFYALRPEGDDWSSKQLYFPDTNILITRFFTPDGVGEVQDFMPIEAVDDRHAPAPADPPRRRGARRDAVPDRGAAAVRLRARRARGRDAPARRAVPLAGPDAGARGRDRQGDGLRAAPRAPRRRRARDVRPRGRRLADVRARARARGPHLPALPRARDRRDVRRDGGLLAPLGRAVALQGPLARDAPALGADAQAAHLRADRRARGRADDLAARADRRRAQLGLPLHLDPRRRVLALRPAPARLHRGGRGVHALADRPHARLADRPRRARCRSCTGSTGATS